MKRRNLIKSIIAAAALSAVPLTISAEDSFRDFFYKANGFDMNFAQLYWYKEYLENEKHFMGTRQIGNTTFMLTLAMYESERLKKVINISSGNNSMTRICAERVRNMELRLGKRNENLRFITKMCSTLEPDSVIFASADAGVFSVEPGFKNLYFFGTIEPQNEKFYA